MQLNQTYIADVKNGLPMLPDKCAAMCVTSPPYYNLRDYGVTEQIGLESTPEEYIANLVRVFREVRRVLTDDGTLWIVIGDSYNGSNKAKGDTHIDNWLQGTNKSSHKTAPTNLPGLKPKDLIGIPWMLAFALRADGWYLRQDIIWNKNNPMPESVKDRCVKAHEYVFLLSKSKKYYFDHEAIQEIATGFDGRSKLTTDGSNKYLKTKICGNNSMQNLAARAHERWNFKNLNNISQPPHTLHLKRLNPNNEEVFPVRNKRSVWTIPTQPFKGAHFAVFPEQLVRQCILAGSRADDVVLDPFMGSGTTAKVALQLNRKYIGVDINPEYEEIRNKKLEIK